MANEIVKIELYGDNQAGDPVRYTCASNVAIVKGTLCKFSGDHTVDACASRSAAIAGVAAMDKSATDLSTTITLWTNLKADVKASGAIAVGNMVMSADAANECTPIGNPSGMSCAYGRVVEAADDNEVVAVRIRV